MTREQFEKKYLTAKNVAVAITFYVTWNYIAPSLLK